MYESGSSLSLDSEVIMLLAFKKLKSINLTKYPIFALGKPEDTRHLNLVLNTFMTHKQIVEAKS